VVYRELKIGGDMNKGQYGLVPTALFASMVLWTISCAFYCYAHAQEMKDKAADEPLSIINCAFFKSAYFTVEDGKVKTELIKDEWSFVIADLDTNKPKMKRNSSEVSLVVLRRSPHTIYLAELTRERNVNLITLFPEKRIVTFSKQYTLSPLSSNIIVCTSIGRFK